MLPSFSLKRTDSLPAISISQWLPNDENVDGSQKVVVLPHNQSLVSLPSLSSTLTAQTQATHSPPAKSLLSTQQNNVSPYSSSKLSPSKLQPPKASTKGERWDCSLCTFTNTSTGIPSKDKCGMCESRRPSTFKFQTPIKPLPSFVTINDAKPELLSNHQLVSRSIVTHESTKPSNKVQTEASHATSFPKSVRQRSPTREVGNSAPVVFTYQLRQMNGPALSPSVLQLPFPSRQVSGNSQRTEADFSLKVGRSASSSSSSSLASEVSITSPSSFLLRCTQGESKFSCTLSESYSFVRVGRGSSSSLVIPHASISRVHAEFSWKDEKLWIRPFGLVTVDGVQISDTERVFPGSKIGLLAPLVDSTSPPASALLSDTVIEWIVEKHSCYHLALPDSRLQVSRNHCTLSYFGTSDTFTITDHESMNGTFVNRVMIARQVAVPVAVGSEILVGGPFALQVGSRIRAPQEHVYGFILERV